MAEIVDLKTLKPDELVIRIEGREIKVSNIPFEIALDMIAKFDKLQENKTHSNREMMLLFRDIVVAVLHEADSGIDDEWVRKNVNAFQMMRLIEKIVDPMLDALGIKSSFANKKGTKKK